MERKHLGLWLFRISRRELQGGRSPNRTGLASFRTSSFCWTSSSKMLGTTDSRAALSSSCEGVNERRCFVTRPSLL